MRSPIGLYRLRLGTQQCADIEVNDGAAALFHRRENIYPLWHIAVATLHLLPDCGYVQSGRSTRYCATSQACIAASGLPVR